MFVKGMALVGVRYLSKAKGSGPKFRGNDVTAAVMCERNLGRVGIFPSQ